MYRLPEQNGNDYSKEPRAAIAPPEGMSWQSEKILF
jgi:hypothetical protein